VIWLSLVGIGSLLMAGLLVHKYAGGAFYLLPFRAWELLAGGALALGWLPRLESEQSRLLMRLLGLIAIGYAALAYSEFTVFPGFAALAPVLGAAAIIHAGTGQRKNPRLLAARPVVYVGQISYSLYLWHWPVIVFADYLGFVSDDWSHSLALAALSLTLASLSFNFIEQPFRKEPPQGMPWRLGLATGAVSLILVIASWGINERGFSGRFDAAVLKYDNAKSVPNPFLNCFNLPLTAACQIGDQSVKPELVLWGDSHALTWAVAFDAALTGVGKSAWLVSTSACPPFIDLENKLNPRCRQFNAQIPDFLSKHREIHTVVFSGFWSTYFRAGGPISYVSRGQTHSHEEGAGKALSATVDLLQEKGLQSILIGPVPVYPRSVPTALAMERITERQFLDRSRQFQDDQHEVYRQQVRTNLRDKTLMVEPMDWLCSKRECRVDQAGVPLYRDSHHLSAAGATLFVGEVVQMIRITSPHTVGSAVSETKREAPD
jgi:hypothetical protein